MHIDQTRDLDQFVKAQDRRIQVGAIGIGGPGLNQQNHYSTLGVGGGSVWVICPDISLDGPRDPVKAFRSKADADKAMELLGYAGAHGLKLCEVAFW